ncbi:hypothetical protein Hanom_Chr06g00542391 [Helianthus anomalus]
MKTPNQNIIIFDNSKPLSTILQKNKRKLEERDGCLPGFVGKNTEGIVPPPPVHLRRSTANGGSLPTTAPSFLFLRATLSLSLALLPTDTFHHSSVAVVVVSRASDPTGPRRHCYTFTGGQGVRGGVYAAVVA